MSDQQLKAEYIVIEEALSLLQGIEDVLPEARSMALFHLFETEALLLPDKELRSAARSAVIHELLEFLETELNPPQHPRPRLIK